MLVGISWNLRTQFFGLYLLFVAVCLSQNAHGMPASRRRRVSVNMFDGVLASIVRPKLHKVNRRSATKSFYAEIVNHEGGYKWLSPRTGLSFRPIIDGEPHRWIICERGGYVKLAPARSNSPNNTYHFLQNFYSILRLDQNLSSCQMDLSSAENQKRYFQIKRKKDKDLLYHVSTKKYITINLRRITNPSLELTLSEELATEWNFDPL